MYQKVPDFFANEEEHRRKLARALNDALDGRTRAIKDLTIAPSTTSTAVDWLGVTADSLVIVTALTATAASVLASDFWYVPVKDKVTLNHASNPAADLNVRMIAFT